MRTGKQVFRYVPVFGDRMHGTRVPTDSLVRKCRPAGIGMPAGYTVGGRFVFVSDARTGEFYGMCMSASLTLLTAAETRAEGLSS